METEEEEKERQRKEKQRRDISIARGHQHQHRTYGWTDNARKLDKEIMAIQKTTGWDTNPDLKHLKAVYDDKCEKLWKMLLKHNQRSIQKEKRLLHVTFKTNKNLAHKHIKKAFPEYHIQRVAQEVRRVIDASTQTPRGIITTNSQVNTLYFHFAPFKPGTRLLQRNSKDVTSADVMARVGSRTLPLFTSLVLSILGPLRLAGFRWYARGAFIQTVPGITKADWVKIEDEHSDFTFDETETIDPKTTNAFTIYMPLESSIQLKIGAIGVDSPREKEPTTVELQLGDYMLFSYRQYHQTGPPLQFPTTPSLRFHINVSDQERLVVDDPEREGLSINTYRRERRLRRRLA